MKPVLLLLLLMAVGCGMQQKSFYSSPDTPWEEGLGNHRAILEIDAPVDAAVLDILWRRHDRYPERKKFIIIHESGEDTIPNIHRLQVDNERCKLAFGPVPRSGRWYFYYLPYHVQEGWGFYHKGYLASEEKADKKWLESNGLVGSNNADGLPNVKCTGFQSRTDFDTFFPMEVIALKSEKDSLLAKYRRDFLVFPEDRKFPIRMLDEIPQKWIQEGPSDEFTGEAQKNEYYAFQLGVFASQKNLDDIKIEFSGLKKGDENIASSRMTCFNTGGTGPYGKPFVKRVDVSKGDVHPLWIGIDIPDNVNAGTWRGEVTVKPENCPPQTIKIKLKINNSVLADRGDSEPWRHSRLRWLNSTLGIDDLPAKPFKSISFPGEGEIQLTNKKITLSNTGLPGSINIKGTELLNAPVSLIVETSDGEEKFSELRNFQLLKNKPGIVSGSWESFSENVELKGIGTIEADGYIHYKITLKALKSLTWKDVRLEIPVRKGVAEYMMGMGLPGTEVPVSHDSKWEGPHDSFWIGNTQAGIWCELRGGDYHGPLLNLYHPDHPQSWFNDDRGGFKIISDQEEVKAVAFTGGRDLNEGEEVTYEWAMLLTPMKEIDPESQFTDRYYHNGRDPFPSDKDLECGVKIVNLHHANNYNPHINYPFIAVDSMRWFVNEMHKKGQKVKIYYTIRELTNYTTELWALRSLGDEILGNGRGGGYPWLREHLVSGYRPQWYQHFPDKSADASVVNAPGDSRWYNYYIEGLAWLVKNVDIDGLYLDDVSYDRRTVKRIRKVLDNSKEGCLLDLHSNTGFSKGPATQYAEFFPYMDKLWFGESFRYSEMPPANWLVEVSGIPFGLMGDMLHGGGNKWLGMLFCMTVRHPWMTEGVVCDPRPVWKVWDQFGIEDSEMAGFWEEDPVVKTSGPYVKATAYIKNDSMLISLGNFSDEVRKVSLDIDWDAAKIDPRTAKFIVPEIEDFQKQAEFAKDQIITIPPRQGLIIKIN